jgi:hypothetical protein
MIILPQTIITDESFKKWKCHRVDVDDDTDGSFYHYYVIPLIDIDKDNISNLEGIPTLYSSYSDEYVNRKDKDKSIFTVRLDTHLTELTCEQEVELLYKILTKKELLMERLEK